MKKNILYILLAALFFTACQSNPPEEPTMVVEAWIDADGYPVVLLHKSFIAADIPDSVKDLETIIEQQLIMWGKVVISNGDTDIIMTGRLDTMYMPPYTYYTINMVGEVGKTYSITATYKNFHASATTTVPPVATLDSVRVTTIENKLPQVTAYMSHLPNEWAGYALFMRYKGDKQFKLCPYNVFDNSKAKENRLEVKVYNPLTNESVLDRTLELDTTRLVELKIARLDQENYAFWSEYEIMNRTRGIMFVPVFTNLHGNIEGGYGNFTGMGSSIYPISLTKDSLYQYE